MKITDQTVFTHSILSLLILGLYGCIQESTPSNEDSISMYASNDMVLEEGTDQILNETKVEDLSYTENDLSYLNDLMMDRNRDEGIESIEDMFTAECIPHNDMCPEGQYCQYLDGRLQCIDNGDVAPDPQFHRTPSCPTGVCSRGGICYNDHRDSTREAKCFWVCDPASIDSDERVCMNRRHTCYQAEDTEGNVLPFAICDY